MITYLKHLDINKSTFFEVASLVDFFSLYSLEVVDGKREDVDVFECKREESSTKLLSKKCEGRNEFQSPSDSGFVDPKI